MSRRSRFRPAARRDVARLAEHFADAPPDIAEELIRKLEERVDFLRNYPFTGRPLRNSPFRETIIAYGKSRYIIRYKVTDTLIQIIRIWHGKENRPPR